MPPSLFKSILPLGQLISSEVRIAHTQSSVHEVIILSIALTSYKSQSRKNSQGILTW